MKKYLASLASFMNLTGRFKNTGLKKKNKKSRQLYDFRLLKNKSTMHQAPSPRQIKLNNKYLSRRLSIELNEFYINIGAVNRQPEVQIFPEPDLKYYVY